MIGEGGAEEYGPGGGGAGRGAIDPRPRDTLYLSSHRSLPAGRTKKEIGFADFDPFVFGQRPAGAEKSEGALIGRPGSAPRGRLRASLRRASSRAVAERDQL